MTTASETFAPTNNLYYNENHILYLNGEFLKSEKTFSDLYGQTLHYGYGVFEGIRAYNTPNGTKIFKSDEHYERLKKSSELINIPFEFDSKELTQKTYELLERNNFTDAYIRPLVFCSPNMGLSTPNQVSLMICAWEWGAYLGEKRLNLGVSSFCRPHPRSTKIEAKVCGHYVNSILASSEAKAKGFDEALLLDSDGFLAEGPGANLFFEKDRKLFTPQLGNILPGITRATVMQLCKELKIEVIEGLYLPEELEKADSAFLCGTAAEIIGVDSLNHQKFPLQWENSLGRKLQQAYKNLVTEKAHSLEAKF
ncbi:branched-chain amino acid transaminase [Flavobacterium oreochromis]|uniref:Branched-chain-amino-acid aminotransferase n=3 Tax=Flavobacterium TaxID=237 RepID=A0A246GBL5_9FLAO|nr:branched-chain amino acid transaminase [Flavobacterium oreochromis]OWP75829.1 branched-chain amino acid aminotransferase [Flavobacterium oreochromis]OWP76370.1 branched-chain amino acid aminotransferase [Flavobacterium oreochromis]